MNSPSSHPRPDVLDLGADHCVNRVLVSVPVLSAPVDHGAVWTFNDVPVTSASCQYNGPVTV